jgi:DNA-binding CsgD family transcriptional regulator
LDLADHFVGRGAQLARLDDALDSLKTARADAVQVVGEAGIGKTRLLTEFAARADARGHIVLRGSGADLDRDLAFWVFVDALDAYIESVEPHRLRLENLDADVRTELAHVFPALTGLADRAAPTFQDARHRTNRAVRALLERLAATKPLVLILDDVHWADAASIDLLASLLHRPPSAPVLLVLAARPHQVSPRLATALQRATRDRSLTPMSLGPLTADEAAELLGRDRLDAPASALYAEAGGNPFYLEQLGRSTPGATATATAAAPLDRHVKLAGVQVPPLVAAALIEELALLSPGSRRVLEGASVAGDPFEPELAATAADVGEQQAMDAIDELLRQDLLRLTDLPRRFRFRHPIVRRTVYETTPGAWRIGAHERAAAALAQAGATAVTRAHHVERCARVGNLDAVATLTEAGDQTAQRAPAAATRWFSAALRLLPDGAPASERVGLLLRNATALAVIGRFDDAHAALLESLAIVSHESAAVRTRLSTTCARVEHLMGAHERAQARLEGALGEVVDQGSPEAVALMMELAMGSVHRMDYASMQAWGERAAGAGRLLGDTALRAASVAALARAGAFSGATPKIIEDCDEAAALVDALSDEELARRLDAATHLAGAETYLQRFADAQRHAERAMAVGHATGQGQFFPQLLGTLGSVWSVRGVLADAVEPLDGAIDAARMTGNPHTVSWALFARSMVALQAGDVELAYATAQESADLADDGRRSHLSAWAAVALAGALLHRGEPRRAADVLIASAGGDDLPLTTPNWRTHSLDLLTRCELAAGQPDAARRAARCADSDPITLPLPRALAERAMAAVALHDGDPARAAELALRSADTLQALDAPIEAAVSRTLGGRALADLGEPDQAVEQLERATRELDRVGALRLRAASERELRKLGRHIHRRSRPGQSDQSGVASLTEREQQIARLIVDRKTNAEIAGELFLSKKTVETHIRNMFRKLDAASRAEIARAVEQADRTAAA